MKCRRLQYKLYLYAGSHGSLQDWKESPKEVHVGIGYSRGAT